MAPPGRDVAARGDHVALTGVALTGVALTGVALTGVALTGVALTGVALGIGSRRSAGAHRRQPA